MISAIRLPSLYSSLQPIFVGKKLEHDLKPKDIKPSIVSQQVQVYGSIN